MAGVSDDLTKPLGQDRPARRPVVSRKVGTAVFGVAALGLGATLVGGALYGDPRGGRPVARSEIAARPVATAPPAEREPKTETNRREASDVEEEAGVRVVRAGGGSAPGAVVVQVPGQSRTLARAPDPRLAEGSRFGILPRIGPDGAKAVEVYAGPVAHLPDGRPALGRIAIVVGGLGLSRVGTDEAIARLPPAVSLAFAPYANDLEQAADRARQAGHEILLQIPMEPFDYPDSDPGPRTLTVAAKPTENAENLRWAMGRFPGYVALMNYMGGKLTADDKALGPVLREAEQRGVGFLDDGSSSRSRIAAIAGEARIARADLVLDATPRADVIDKSLQQLEAVATSGKLAVATASALPVTVDRIAAWAATLETRGILLVPVSAAMVPRRRESASR